MWRRTFGRQKVLPRTPFQKTFFRWGRWSPPLDGGERTTARGPGKQEEEGIVPSSSCFWCVWRALRAQRTFERMPGIKQTRGGQSAFRVLCHERRHLCQRAVLVLVILPGDRQWGLSGVVPGSPSSCIKRVGRRMGAWGKEGPLRASRRPKAAAGRARCDEGSYGHRQQGKVPPSPKKLAYMWKKRRGGTPGIMRASASLR